MATLSIRIPDELLDALDLHAKALKMPRAEYVRHAIERLNQAAEREEKKRIMKAASERVRGESMKVLEEFESLPDDLP